MAKTADFQGNLDQGPGFHLHVVLVRTLYESNIGATSRAMANMGAQRLILIAPQCEIGDAAQKAAATGQMALQQKTIYPDWDNFYAKESAGIRIALTARTGKVRDVRDLAETLNWIRTDHQLFKVAGPAVPVYFIFGPEDWGLSTEDMSLSHYACCIPTFGENWSLNLAQAVLLALYTLRLAWGGQVYTVFEKNEELPPAVFPEETLKTWVTEMGFQIDHSKVNVFAILRKMLLHSIPSAKELSVLEVVLQQSIRKLKEYNELRKSVQNK